MNILSQYPRLKKISGPPQLGEQSKILQSKVASYGPGTELKKLLQELGISMKSSCGCESRATQMNIWGVKGCRNHLEEIVVWIKSASNEVSVFDKVMAGWNALKLRIPLDPLDPFRSIVLIAISRAEKASVKTMEWSYGVTTVPSRLNTTLPVTLESLKLAGFETPRLFIDDCEDASEFKKLDLPITSHWPRMHVNGNWILSVIELYLRQPEAQRYAIFQDDFVTYRNLRQYLEQVPYPENGYCNLYTVPRYERAGAQHKGWFKAIPQYGIGAVALVFTRDAVKALFDNRHMIDKMHGPDPVKRIKSVDGGIVSAMNKSGWYEYVHMPSLVQHIGDVSAAGNDQSKKPRSFRGESYDALEMLR